MLGTLHDVSESAQFKPWSRSDPWGRPLLLNTAEGASMHRGSVFLTGRVQEVKGVPEVKGVQEEHCVFFWGE